MLTFIIPTIGRDTLSRTIQSLLELKIKTWKAIVVFDGVKKNVDIKDDRIKYIEIEKKGKGKNSAGMVRNIGMASVDTKWIAFIDDDDTISAHYINYMMKELELKKDLDVIIFRMLLGKGKDKKALPKFRSNNFFKNEVGISFVMKKKIYDKGARFKPSSMEDFILLNEIRAKKYKMCISPRIAYFVRQNKIPVRRVGRRVYIN